MTATRALAFGFFVGLIGSILPSCGAQSNGSVCTSGICGDSGSDARICPQPAVAAEVPIQRRVIPVYLATPDTPQGEISARAASMYRAMIGIQSWYGEAMGTTYHGMTFPLEPVHVVRSQYTRAQWDDYGVHGFEYPDGGRTKDGGECAMWFGVWFELGERGLLSDAGLPPLNSGTIYVAMNGGGNNGACGGGQLAAFEGNLLNILRLRCPDGRNDACASGCRDAGPECSEPFISTASPNCTAVGAIAHELGHAFGLPHGQDRSGIEKTLCDHQTLMDLWWEYDEGPTLCDPERRDLADSGFFAAPK